MDGKTCTKIQKHVSNISSNLTDRKSNLIICLISRWTTFPNESIEQVLFFFHQAMSTATFISKSTYYDQAVIRVYMILSY